MPSLYYCHNCEDAVPLRNSDLVCAICGSDFIEETEVPMMVPPFLHPTAHRAVPSLFGIRVPPPTTRNPHADPRNPHTDPSSPYVRPRSQSVPRSTSNGQRPTRRENNRAPITVVIEGIAGHRTNGNTADQNPGNAPNRNAEETANRNRRNAVNPNAEDTIRDHLGNLFNHIYQNPGVFGGVARAYGRGRIIPHHVPEEPDQPMDRVELNAEEDVHRDDERPPPVNHRRPEPREYRVELVLGPTIANGDMGQVLDIIMNGLDEAPPDHLTEEEIQRVPIVKVEQSHIDNKTQCSTCFEDFIIDEEVARLNCSHIFHPDCLKPWLRMHNTCPMCRTEVDPATWATTGTQTGGPQNLPQSVIPPPAAAPPGMIDADELD